MPVRVILCALSGEKIDCILPAGATVRDLKAALWQRGGVKPSLLRLVTISGSECEDEADLITLTECPLADVLDRKTLKRVLLEVELHAVLCMDVCFVCAASSARRCAGCRRTRYCSRACQLHDWRRHRLHCTARLRRFPAHA